MQWRPQYRLQTHAKFWCAKISCKNEKQISHIGNKHMRGATSSCSEELLTSARNSSSETCKSICSVLLRLLLCRSAVASMAFLEIWRRPVWYSWPGQLMALSSPSVAGIGREILFAVRMWQCHIAFLFLLLCRHRAGTPNTADITAIVFLKKKIAASQGGAKHIKIQHCFYTDLKELSAKSRPSLKLANREYLSLRVLAKL